MCFVYIVAENDQTDSTASVIGTQQSPIHSEPTPTNISSEDSDGTELYANDIAKKIMQMLAGAKTKANDSSGIKSNDGTSERIRSLVQQIAQTMASNPARDSADTNETTSDDSVFDENDQEEVGDSSDRRQNGM